MASTSENATTAVTAAAVVARRKDGLQPEVSMRTNRGLVSRFPKCRLIPVGREVNCGTAQPTESR